MFNWGSVPKQPPSIIEYYLREATICLNRGAHRMSVVASACALNFGLDFVLRQRNLVSKRRLLSLNKAIENVEQEVSVRHSKMLSKSSIEKCKKVMHYRNAFAHPEDYLEVKPSSQPHLYTLKPKFATEPEKKQAYEASQLYMRKELKKMAKESFEITFNSIKEALENLLLP